MREKIKYFVISVIVISLMVIATFNDLKIAEKIYNPDMKWAHIFKVIGEFPIYLGLLLFGVTYYHLANKKIYKNLLLVEAFVSFFLFLFMPFRYVFDTNLISVGIIFLISTCMFFILMKLSYKIDNNFYEKIKTVVLIYFVGVLTQLTIVYAMKLCWSRVRFLELETISEFTRWYVINWFDGTGTSFPSGHTSGATNIMYLTLFVPLFTNDKKKHILIEFLCFSFIGLTALSRLVLGKHYLSDVTFAFALTYIIHIIVTKSIKDRQK